MLFCVPIDVTIAPSDPRIVYVGRFDRTSPDAPRCQWSASEVRLLVRSKEIVATFSEAGGDFWQVIVDGDPKEVLQLDGGKHDYTIQLGGANIHEVRFVKRTEPFVGTTTVLGFAVRDGSFLADRPSRKHIQIIGDSISCAFGNEGKSAQEAFAAKTENAYQSYGSIAARTLDADVQIVAWSGRKMWPDNTIPEIYDRVIPTEPNPIVSLDKPIPDVIVINLATNDFGKENPDRSKWEASYEEFLRKLRTRYPKAQIYLAMGPMMSDGYPVGHNALTTLRGYLTEIAQTMNDSRIATIEFPVQQEADGIGSSWHPSVKTHQKMAKILADRIRQDLNW